MQILLKPEQWVFEYYPQCDNNDNLTLSKYVIIEECEDGILLFHSITWSIYLLSKSEYEDILNNEWLIDNYIVLNNDIDELSIANKVYEERMIKKKLPDYNTINSFVVFTTTACNARCAYCFEQGMKPETMTIETAENLVQFIKNRYNPNFPVKIQWFGGEPLLNTNVMDYITTRLSEMEITYETTIVTNAFLFNEENITKINDKWKLRHAQITIDGLNDIYNSTKNYVYSDVDAFMTVINNIHNLLENTDCIITIRINISNENIFHIYDTISYLKEEFEKYLTKQLNIYTHLLYDMNKTIDGFEEEYERIREISRVIDDCDFNHLSLEKTLKRTPIYKNCMAFDGTSVAVLPNGKLNICEHALPEDMFGDIICGITNNEVIEKWQTLNGNEINFCKETCCPIHPICAKFYHCPVLCICDNETQKEKKILNAKKQLINTYNYYKSKIKNNFYPLKTI